MEANEAMKAMAESIADDMMPHRILREWQIAKDAALAAIMETQEACAKLAEAELVEVYGDRPEIDTECNHLVRRIATAIRAGEHYALSATIGEDIGGGRGE